MGGPAFGFSQGITSFVRSSSYDVRLCKFRMSTDENMSSVYSRRQALIQVGRIVALSALSLSGFAEGVAGAEANSSADAAAASALAPVINLRMSLSQLGTDIEGGTNGDLRRTIRTLQKGIDIVSAARRASSIAKLPRTDSENIRVHVRDAAEFINQIVDYYDPTAVNERPPAQVLQFSLNALKSAADQLDQAIRVFPQDIVRKARDIVQDGAIV